MPKMNALEQMMAGITEGREAIEIAYDAIEQSRTMLEEAMTSLRIAQEDFEYWQLSNNLQIIIA